MADIARSVFAVAQQVYTIAQNVKANKQQALRLRDRVQTLSSTISGLPAESLSRPAVERALSALILVLKDAQELLVKLSASNALVLAVQSGSNKEKFAEINLRLSQAATDLNVGLNVESIFQAVDDKADQAQDQADVESRHEELKGLIRNVQDQQHVIQDILERQYRSFMFHLKRSTKEQKRQIDFEEIPFYDLKVGERLGTGGFGTVYKGVWISRQMDVAIKVLHAPDFTQSVQDSFYQELAAMQSMRFENVVNVLGACTEPGNYSIVMEFCSRGSLFNVIHSKEEQSWSVRLALARDAAKGVNFLHQKRPPLLHRDIKSLNFVVDAHNTVKLGDFGLSKARQETITTTSMAGPAGGTIHWTAPELLRSINAKHTTASDVYALGVVFWEIASREQPYAGVFPERIKLAVLEGQRPDIPEDTPTAFAKLIADCWAQDPHARPDSLTVVRRLQDIISGATTSTGDGKQQATEREALAAAKAREDAERERAARDQERERREKDERDKRDKADRERRDKEDRDRRDKEEKERREREEKERRDREDRERREREDRDRKEREERDARDRSEKKRKKSEERERKAKEREVPDRQRCTDCVSWCRDSTLDCLAWLFCCPCMCVQRRRIRKFQQWRKYRPGLGTHATEVPSSEGVVMSVNLLKGPADAEALSQVHAPWALPGTPPPFPGPAPPIPSFHPHAHAQDPDTDGVVMSVNLLQRPDPDSVIPPVSALPGTPGSVHGQPPPLIPTFHPEAQEYRGVVASQLPTVATSRFLVT